MERTVTIPLNEYEELKAIKKKATMGKKNLVLFRVMENAHYGETIIATESDIIEKLVCIINQMQQDYSDVRELVKDLDHEVYEKKVNKWFSKR